MILYLTGAAMTETADQRVWEADRGPIQSEPNLLSTERRRGRCKHGMIYVTPFA